MRRARMACAVLAVVAAGSTACSGTSVGTGRDGSSGSSGTTDTSRTTPGPTDGRSSTSEPDYSALFGRPTTTDLTPDSLGGLWAGTMSSSHDDVRIKIEKSLVTIAIRCTTGSNRGSVMGIEVGAVVSGRSIRLTESKAMETICAPQVRPVTFEECDDRGGDCFHVSGTYLYFYGPLFTTIDEGPASTFTKVSD